MKIPKPKTPDEIVSGLKKDTVEAVKGKRDDKVGGQDFLIQRGRTGPLQTCGDMPAEPTKAAQKAPIGPDVLAKRGPAGPLQTCGDLPAKPEPKPTPK